MLYLVFFILFALIVLILAFLRVYLRIEYVRNGWSDHIVISVYIFKGLIKYEYEVNLVNIQKNGINLMRVRKKKLNKEDADDNGKKTMGIQELYERIVYIRERVREFRHIYDRLNSYLKGKIALKELDLRIVLGTGDAFLTGILSGVAWAIAGVIIVSISATDWFPIAKIDIKSDFNKQKLNINLHSIFSVKFVHIIVVGFIFLSNYLKRRWLSWRNIRYKVS